MYKREEISVDIKTKIGKKFVGSIHTHVKSLFDAQIEPEALCKRIIELGGKGCVITDHGVVSSIEDYRAVFASYHLKMIPGIEMYVDGGVMGRLHLILIAMDDIGWKFICKIVTESNYNIQNEFPVISEEKLFSMIKGYKGHVIATSACMQGVIPAVFLINRRIEKKIEKEVEKQKKYTNPEWGQISMLQDSILKLEAKLAAKKEEKNTIKKISEKKTGRIRQTILKTEKEGEDASELKRELEILETKILRANEQLPGIKKEIDDLKKVVSEKNKELKRYLESIKKWQSHQDVIDLLKKEIKTPEEVKALAKKRALDYQTAFGVTCFYAEIQYHGIEEERICFPAMLEIAEELNIPLVAANDVHILTNSADDRLRRCILRSLRYGKSFEEEAPGDAELYLKDNYELAEMLVKIFPEDKVIDAINNIEVIMERCNVEFHVEQHYPKFSKTEDANEILKEEIIKGIKKRFPDGLTKEQRERINYEYETIRSMGYADYHLIVKDFLEYGRLLGYIPKNKISEAPLSIEKLKHYIASNGWENEGMLIGPGRGSAVGSLVCYVLGITDLDPMKYGLLFERFLNPERVSMPDIDSDIGATTREKVIEYVKTKYGERAVCGIMTVNAQAPKGCLRMSAKYYGLKKNEQAMTTIGDILAKEIPENPKIKFSSTVAANGEIDPESNVTLKDWLLQKYTGNVDLEEIIRWACIIEGIFTSYGAHAAGIVISDNDDISEYLPLRMGKTGMTTQCDMVQVEENGLLKFDFLGLKTLDIITETLRMVEKNTGKIINPKEIDLEDKNVYNHILSTGKTNSVFQFESSGMKAMLKKFKPSCFEDLIILVSMFRPGPLQYLDDVCKVKNKQKQAEYLCKELKPILEKTYGAIVYQEQVMEIFQKLAGYTLGGADMVRRYMSKKKEEKLEQERKTFIRGDVERKIVGCVANGIKEETANKLFNQMMAFAAYAFNKSHATAYAFNAYVTAWLKYYYPAEFFAAALNWTDNEGISGLINEAISCGVKVQCPNVNTSEVECNATCDTIIFGLSLIKGVNSNAKTIVKERNKSGNFQSFADFLIRTNSNKNVIENLIAAGTFDLFCKNRKAVKEGYEKIKQMKTDQEKNAYVFSDVTESKTERLNEEKKFLGAYITEHPMDFYPNADILMINRISGLSATDKKIYGVITDLNIKHRKADGKEMAFFNLEDKTGKIEVAVFAKAYEKYKDTIKEGNVVILFGSMNVETEFDENDNEVSNFKFFAQSVVKKEELPYKVILAVSSVATFHLDIENIFMKKYEAKEGEKRHLLYLYDIAMKEMRSTGYYVSEKVLELKDVKKFY